MPTIAAAAGIVALWGSLLAATWANWGDVTIDCGREMYVPWLLAQGKTLYTDVWYLYGPAAPYVNAFLFYCFGPHLAVLYFAGALAALACAWLLFLTGLTLGFRMAGFTAAAVVLLQSFVPFIFCFPLPYSFSAVYGCLVTCFFLWCVVHVCEQSRRTWLLAAGLAAGLAVLMKLEFGFGCYGALAFLLSARAAKKRTARFVAFDLLAVLPGIVFCAAVIIWMVSLRGPDFLTQENFMSWPSSYFMRTYGAQWLRVTGFDISFKSVGKALIETALLLGFWLLLRFWGARVLTRFRRSQSYLIAAALGTWFFIGAGMYFVGGMWRWIRRIHSFVSLLFFPPQMVFLLCLALLVTICCYRRLLSEDRNLHLVVLMVLAVAVAFRHLFTIGSDGYAIFYNGPVILSFLFVMRAFIAGRSATTQATGILVVPCLGLFLIAASIPLARIYASWGETLPLRTERGVIRIRAEKLQAYQSAIALMKEKTRQGQAIMTIPEDTALYFLSGTICPTRVFAFPPGTLSPGPTTDRQIRDMERARVQWIIWSNRSYPEYDSPVFGLTFDRPLGDYIRTHFSPVGRLLAGGEWQATVWQRVENGHRK